MSHLSRRVDAVKRRLEPDELILISICPKCGQTILGRGAPSAECDIHELAPPLRPGEKTIVLRHRWSEEPQPYPT
jgi:predicted RNA-binding Zn-ribbon protein involved in translation (DUF1610 family)